MDMRELELLVPTLFGLEGLCAEELRRLKLPEGWRVSVLSSHTEFERTFGRTADKKRKLYNGMLKCDLFQYGR